MKKTEYENVEVLKEQFDQYWVPFEHNTIGTSDSGMTIHSLLDKKADTLYLEKYDGNTDQVIVYSFLKGEHPSIWTLEEGGDIQISL